MKARRALTLRLRRRAAGVLSAAVLAGATVVFVREAGWLQRAELAVHDGLVAAWAGGERSARILVVTVTESDIARFDWPLTDAQLAELLERLMGLGARGVAVDIYRDRPRPPGSETLAGVLARHAAVLWVKKLPEAPDDPGVGAPAALAGTSRSVLSDTVPDEDGVVRRALLAAWDERLGETVPTLGTALAELWTGRGLREAGEGLAFGAGRITLVSGRFGPYARVNPEGYQMLLDLRGGQDRFPRLSLAEALEGDVAERVHGRLVLVGSAATSLNDSFSTPLGAGWLARQMPGAVLHAHVAEQLIRIAEKGTTSPAPLPRWAETVAILAAALGAAVLVWLLRAPWLAFLAVLGLAALAGWAASLGFGAGLVLPMLPLGLAWVAGAGAASWALHGVGQRERRQLRRSFEHYLDPRIIENLVEAEALPAFGGERREISVLFTDIAGFTALAESLPPERVAALLGAYFDGVCAEVLRCGGLTSAFLGDGLLALFGAPQQQDDHADRAVEAALRISRFARRFAAEQRAEGVAFGATRIGVHTGVALVGNIGTRARLAYGALGDVVNTASRLEGLNRSLGTCIAVSSDTAARCHRHRFRSLGRFALAGRRAPLLVVTPLDRSGGEAERLEGQDAPVDNGEGNARIAMGMG